MRTCISFCYTPHTAFASRNRQYGAYSLRQSYTQHLWTGFLWGTCFVCFLLVDWVLYENVQAGKTNIKTQGKNATKTVVKEPAVNFNFIPPPPAPPKRYCCVFLIPPTNCYTDFEDIEAPQNIVQEKISETIEPLQTPLPVEMPPKEDFICTLPVIFQKNAQFIGGQEALAKFLHKHIKMPSKVRKGKVKGKAYVRFLVTETGKIKDITLLRGIKDCPQCDREALRLVGKMPDWTPAEREGKPFETHFSLPIVFDYEAYQKRRQE